MPRDERKLVYNGNSICVSIPRQFLQWLGWLPGQRVVLELLEDKTIWVRPRGLRDLEAPGSPRVVYDEVETVVK